MTTVTYSSGLQPRPAITSLSEDLLIAIFEDDCIDLDDVAGLRVTCRALSNAATVVLFRRIRISQLSRDRDGFLAICNSPHLTRHVREVEWQEVSWFPGYFRLLSESHPSGIHDELTEHTCAKLDDWADKSFWLNVVPEEQPNIDRKALIARREASTSTFRSIFHQAFSKLPFVNTFISRPMLEDRVLDYDYPITVMHLNYHQTPNFKNESEWLPQTNDGLFLFLLPEMESSVRPITRLIWEDQSPAISGQISELYPRAFGRLDTLSICLLSNWTENHNTLAVNLDAAINVRDLSLEVKWKNVSSSFQCRMLGFSLQEKRMRWSRLHSLSLNSMSDITEILVPIVASNSDTLRHLYINDCNLPYKTVKALADIQSLLLKSFRVVEHIDTPNVFIEEDALLAYINKMPIIIVDHCYQLASDDEWGSKSGFYQHRLTSEDDSAIITTFCEKYQQDKSYTFEEEELTDEEQSIYSDDDSEDSHGNRIISGPKWAWGYYPNTQTFGDVYYYQVPDTDPDGNTTKCWKFTSRDNNVAFGDEPSDYFEDWDPESGDVEEPTPYCAELIGFYDSCMAGGLVQQLESSFSQIPPDGARKFDRIEAETAYRMSIP